MKAPYYSDDLVTLYHGDCREITEWLAGDVLVTDPPYGINYGARRGGTGKQSKGCTRESVANDHDFSTTAAALDLWGAKPVAACANHASLPRTLVAVTEHLSKVRIATWHKTNVNGGTPGNPWLADVEFAVCGVTEWPTFAKSGLISARRFTGNPAWQGPDAYLHPTQKPILVMELLIDAMPEGVIADPFAGSGSTLVAAKRQGRKAIGVELEERYCEITARRLLPDSLPFGEAS